MPGWPCMIRYSSSRSLPGLSRMLAGTPIFPMSWSNPPRCKFSSSSGASPKTRPIFKAISVTLSEWPAVQGDFASTARARAVKVPQLRRSSSSSSCAFDKATATWSASWRAWRRSSWMGSDESREPRTMIPASFCLRIRERTTNDFIPLMAKGTRNGGRSLSTFIDIISWLSMNFSASSGRTS